MALLIQERSQLQTDRNETRVELVQAKANVQKAAEFGQMLLKQNEDLRADIERAIEDRDVALENEAAAQQAHHTQRYTAQYP
jgi:hypothetical protein